MIIVKVCFTRLLSLSLKLEELHTFLLHRNKYSSKYSCSAYSSLPIGHSGEQFSEIPIAIFASSIPVK